jgi:hypothetical protein
MSITEQHIEIIERNLKLGTNLEQAIVAAGLEANLNTLLYLQQNCYDRLTAAKYGEGHVEAQAAARAAMNGSG